MKCCFIVICVILGLSSALGQPGRSGSLQMLIDQISEHSEQDDSYELAFQALDQIILYSLPLADSIIVAHITSSALFHESEFRVRYHLSRSKQAAVLYQTDIGQAHLDTAQLIAQNLKKHQLVNEVMWAQAGFDLKTGNYKKSQKHFRELHKMSITQQDDSLQVLSLLNMAGINVTLWKVQQAFEQIDSAQVLAGDYQQLEVQKERCWAIYQSGNLQGALDSVLVLQKNCAANGYIDLDIACEKLVAQIYYHWGIYLPAIAAYTRIQNDARMQHNRVEMINQLSNIAYAHRMLGNFSEAIHFAQLRVSYCDSLGYEQGKAGAYLSMYQVYLDNKDVKLQMESISKAEAIYEKYHDRGGLANVYNSYGNAYESIKDYEKSLSYYQQCFEIRKDHAQSFWVIPQYNIGNILVKLGRYQESMGHFQESLRVCEEQHIIGMKIRNLSGLAEANMHLGNQNTAQIQIHEAISMVKSTRYQRMKRDVFEIAALIYEKGGDLKQALHFYQMFKIQNDSLFNEESDKRFAHMQTQFETKEKEQENELLRKDVEIKKADIENQRQWTMIAVVILVFSLITGGVFYRKNQQLKEKNREIENQRLSISERNRRIETLLKEVHHRVKNNLQLISSLLDSDETKNNPERAVSILEDSKSRVATMSLIHQRLYMRDEVGSIWLEDYLHDLVNNLVGMYGDLNPVEVAIHSEPIQLDIDTIIPLGLAANELLTNALKYATDPNAAKITIRCYAEPDSTLVLQISDQGQPLPQALEELIKTGYGLRLAYRLAHQLMGSLTHVYDGGNVFTIRYFDTKYRKSIE